MEKVYAKELFGYGMEIMAFIALIGFASGMVWLTTTVVVQNELAGFSLGAVLGGFVFLTGMVGLQYKVIHDAVSKATN